MAHSDSESHSSNHSSSGRQSPHEDIKQKTEHVIDLNKERGVRLWYVKRAYNKPCQTFWLAIALPIILSMLVFLTGSFEIADGGGGNEWDVKSSRRVIESDALETAIDTVAVSKQTLVRSQEHFPGNLVMMYETLDGSNIFTADNLATIKDIEDNIMLQSKTETNNGVEEVHNYSAYCLLIYNDDNIATGCATPPSLVGVFYEGETLVDIDAKLQEMAADPITYGYYTGNTFTTDNLETNFARSKYPIGLPLVNFVSSSDDLLDQEEIILKWLLEVEDYLLDRFGMTSSLLGSPYLDDATEGNLRVRWMSWPMAGNEISRTVNNDFTWTVFCLMFLFGYMAIHTKSFLLTTVGIVEIILSFPTAYFILYFPFRVTYFSQLHILAVFVIMGVGADDVFVFVDAFKQSELFVRHTGDQDETDLMRLVYSTKRASKTIFVTSFTTFFAFMATAISDIMPISSFGIFAGLMVVSVFVFNCVLLPPILIFWHRNFRYRSLMCKKIDSPSPGASQNQVAAQGGDEEEPEIDIPDNELLVMNMRIVERFFHVHWCRLLNSRAKYVIIFIFLGLLGAGAGLASTLEPPTEEESFTPDDHMIGEYIKHIDEDFNTSVGDQTVEVYTVWGIATIDRDGTNRWDPDDKGTVVFDTNFDPSTTAAQTQLAEFCQRVKDEPCSASACQGAKLVQPGLSAECWVDDFETFLGAELPIDPALFKTRIVDFVNDATYGKRWGEAIGVDASDNTVKYIYIKAPSSISFSVGGEDREDVAEEWDRFTTEFNTESPDELQAFATGTFSWKQMATADALVSNSVTGMILSFIASFIVLCISTRNWLVSVLATTTIAGIVVSVLGIWVKGIQDWDFGISESISAIIIIGFSMDYVVHVGNAYVESPRSKRDERLQDSLTEMGISVLAGAITSFGAGAFLYGAVLLFFVKFAFLMTTTIFMSFLWTMLFFAAALSAVGPQDDFASLQFIFDWVAEKVARIRKK